MRGEAYLTPASAARQLSRDQPRREPRVAIDVVEASGGVVVVTDEVEPRLVEAHDPVPPAREALRVRLDQGAEGVERRAETGGEDDVVEPVLGAVGEAGAAGGERRDAGAHVDQAFADRVHQVKAD